MSGPDATVRSMTGAAWVRGATGLGEVSVAVRSLNGKNFAIKSRLPSDLSLCEPQIERLVRDRVARGTVSLIVRIDRSSHLGEQIDVERFVSVAARLTELASSAGLAPVTARDVLAIPGVIATPSADSSDPLTLPDDVAALIRAALDQLLDARAIDGTATVAAFFEHLDGLVAGRERVVERAPAVIDGYRARLIARVNEFLDGRAQQLEPEDVVRELGVFADRVDISEELQRIDSHLTRLRDTLAAGGAVGRTLDFLIQEVLREINTIGSKSPDVAIAHEVVAMKSLVDKLKEQALNLE